MGSNPHANLFGRMSMEPDDYPPPGVQPDPPAEPTQPEEDS